MIQDDVSVSSSPGNTVSVVQFLLLETLASYLMTLWSDLMLVLDFRFGVGILCVHLIWGLKAQPV